MTDKPVPFIIEQNQGGSFAIIENPKSKKFGRAAWCGEKVVRSPFKSVEEARQRMAEIAEHWGYKSIEVSS